MSWFDDKKDIIISGRHRLKLSQKEEREKKKKKTLDVYIKTPCNVIELQGSKRSLYNL